VRGGERPVNGHHITVADAGPDHAIADHAHKIRGEGMWRDQFVQVEFRLLVIVSRGRKAGADRSKKTDVGPLILHRRTSQKNSVLLLIIERLFHEKVYINGSSA